MSGYTLAIPSGYADTLDFLTDLFVPGADSSYLSGLG